MGEHGHSPSIVTGRRCWYHKLIFPRAVPSIVAGWGVCTNFRAFKCDGPSLRAWALVAVSSHLLQDLLVAASAVLKTCRV